MPHLPLPRRRPAEPAPARPVGLTEGDLHVAYLKGALRVIATTGGWVNCVLFHEVTVLGPGDLGQALRRSLGTPDVELGPEHDADTGRAAIRDFLSAKDAYEMSGADDGAEDDEDADVRPIRNTMVMQNLTTVVIRTLQQIVGADLRVRTVQARGATREVGLITLARLVVEGADGRVILELGWSD